SIFSDVWIHIADAANAGAGMIIESDGEFVWRGGGITAVNVSGVSGYRESPTWTGSALLQDLDITTESGGSGQVSAISRSGPASVVFDNVSLRSVRTAVGEAAGLRVSGSAGETTLRNSRIHVDTVSNAIAARLETGNTRIENVTMSANQLAAPG